MSRGVCQLDYLKKNLTQVRPHTYLANSDSDFCEKYLRFFPNDRGVLYRHAQELLKKGKVAEGIRYLEKSSELGNTQAARDLKQWNSMGGWRGAVPHGRETKKSNAWKWWFAFFLVLLLAFLFLVGWKYINNRFFIEQNDYFYQYHEYHQPESPPKDDLFNGAMNTPAGEKTLKETLPLLAASNAIIRYKEMYGSLPKSLDELTGGAPSNFATIHEGLSEELGKLLVKKGDDKEFAAIGKLELDFYPEANKLALVKVDAGGNEELLSSFTVASGKEVLPFKTNKITKRVVNPNGGEGVLGTRGLVLSDGYAIHGTNDPLSIGKKVTHGCIRLNNGDMETLYPYVSIGTPFIVKSGLPGSPIFRNGLPLLKVSSRQLKKEESIDEHFIWNN